MSEQALLPSEAPARPGGTAAPGRRRRSRALRLTFGLVVPAVLVAGWELATATGAVERTLLPTPGAVARALARFFAGPRTTTLPGITPFDGAGFEAVGASLRRLLTAYALAAAVGIPSGLAIGLSRRTALLFDPLVQGLRAIPIFAWLPLAIVWFGLGEGPARYLVFIGAVFPIVVATGDAAARVPGAYVETARMLGTRRRDLARRIYLPAALPGILTGLRLGLSLGWMSLIVGELTGTRSGIGAMMTAAREAGRLDQVLVGMFCFAVLGLTGDALLRGLTRRYVAWSAG